MLISMKKKHASRIYSNYNIIHIEQYLIFLVSGWLVDYMYEVV